MFNLKRLALVFVLVFTLALPFIVMAQELTLEPSPTAEGTLEPTPSATPTPVIVEPPPPNPIPDDPNDPPVTTPENLLGQLYSLLKDATFMAWAAAGVIVIVGLIKIVASVAGYAIEGNVAVVITLIVQVLIWLGYAITNYFGQGEAFRAWYLALVDVARSLLPLFGAIFLGHIGYQQAAKRGVPVLGFYPKAKAQPRPNV